MSEEKKRKNYYPKHRKKAKRKQKKPGAKSTYKPIFAEQAYKLALLGLIDKELAEFFEVSPRTLIVWKKTYPAFDKALKRGKKIADGNVVESLYKRANGFEHLDTNFSSYQGKVTATEYLKHYPPDTTACIYWLKNRNALWSDRIDHTLSGLGGGPVEVESEFKIMFVARQEQLTQQQITTGDKPLLNGNPNTK